MARRAPAPRFRAAALWLVLAAITFAAGFAVYHLYSTLRREIYLQGLNAMVDSAERFTKKAEQETAATLTEVYSQLAGFHLDGLSPGLRRWDESRPDIVATFLWDQTNGLTATTHATEIQNALNHLWPSLRSWRSTNPQAKHRPPQLTEGWQTEAQTTLNNPNFAGVDFAYQSENIDLLAYEKQRIDPWIGYAAPTGRPESPWIIWYQIGPDTPVRGCLLDPGPLLARLKSQLADGSLSRQSLDPDAGLNPFPGYKLSTFNGTLFASKQSAAAIAAFAVALLLALVLLAAFTLAHFTRRASLEAERKTTFVAQVSHELRTPLTSIQMFADMLGAHALPEEKREKYLGHITRETARLRHLVERLLSFSALEQNKFQPALESVELGALVQEVLDETTALLSAAGLAPDNRLPAEKIEARSDRAALKQALLNLLENAAKYAPQSGPLVLASETTAREIRLRVSDAGPGIPAAIRGTLFEPFVQGDETLTGKKPGLGLGLSIARGQLRAGGADLVLLPADRGATFELRIPRGNF